MTNFKDKVVIITGAKQGMGKTHALSFAKRGAKVVVSDISKEECEKVVEEIEQERGEALAVKCNVLEKSEVDNLLQETIDQFGKIDVLVNNAGVAQFKPFLELTEEDWDKTINVNLRGYFLCAQAAAKQMKEQGGGKIVNIASVAMGQVGLGFQTLAHYSASKGGIVAMTETLAGELSPYDIRVNAVAPGMIETPMISPIEDDPQQREATLNKIPMGRVGEPQEITNVVMFLASDDSSYMTGSTVVADGGWLAT